MLNRYSPVITVVALATLIAITACGNTANSNYCPGKNPDNNCTEPEMCESNSTCSAPTAVCNTQTSMCVQCTTANVSACGLTNPICGTDDKCRACSAHSDCKSNACLPDGSCGTDNNVAYVAAGQGVADNSMCDEATPCKTVAAALATNKTYVKFQGATSTIDEAVVISAGRQVTFLADPGAKLTHSGTAGAIITVQDAGSTLAIYDLTITKAPNDPTGIGINMTSAGGMTAVSLARVSITNNPGGGISATSGTLKVSQSTISGNAGGGISVSGAQFDIVGNAFSGNGTGTSTVGGVLISTSTSAVNRLDFNSFSRNQTQDGLGSAIQCVAGSFTASNNIMSGNGTLTNTQQVSGTCNYNYSIVTPGTLPQGPGNLAADPKFVNSAMGDLHISSDSPARGKADLNADLTGIAAFDIDGTPRTKPADIGAYEYKGQ